MTKKQIINLLLALKREQINDIYVVYHNPKSGILCLDTYSLSFEYARFKLTLYRLRKDIKYVSVDYVVGLKNFSAVYFDDSFPVCMSLYTYLTKLKKNKTL